MYNHFLMFPDEPAARDALPDYCRIDDNGAWFWHDDVIPNQIVVLSRAQWDYSDHDTPVLITPQQVLPGYFLTVSLSSISVTLRDMPNAACRLIGDSDTGSIVYTAPDLDANLIASAFIEPIPAGSQYTFGV